ncbi:MAG: hypothetical protein EZS26_001288 [Candidatus Ordinivivax streblomastigis]|uniref:Uncharacterized protein n=1 Tax=Candidatus Ordinivivax streblomastigis TaxID=2540710 RepID=A0A5M8P296_9BACT|nr:MAG: hypothetical protein EZS26_001288 [Candidatus Ordinivivax streblomastigis]
MSKKTNPFDEIGNVHPFKVPEGYFEGLTGQIMSQLPERTSDPQKVLSLWDRVKPWTYMAAMFAGIALMVNLFTRVAKPSQDNSTIHLSSVAEMEDFYQYYEEQVAGNMYHESVYLDFD